MPSIEVNCSGLSRLDQKCSTESSKLSKDKVDTDSPRTCTGKINPKSRVKMPCNPYGKSGAALLESPPTEKRNLPLQKNGITYTGASLELKPKQKVSNMAPDSMKKHPFDNEESKVKQGEKEQKFKTKKPKPRSFSLLEMTYNKEKGENDRGRLVRQRSVKNSFEKETHLLTHAVSAPAALSSDLEPRQEDEVFEKINEEEPSVTNVATIGTPESKEEDEASQGGNVEEEEERDEGIVIKPKNEETKLGTDKEGKQEIVKNVNSEDILAEINEKKNEGEENESIREAERDELVDAKKVEGHVKEEKMTPEASWMEKVDVDSLTDELQIALQIEDTSHKVKEDVDTLAKNMEQGLSIGDKFYKETMKPKCGISSGRLRAKGLPQEDTSKRPHVIMTTNDAFEMQQQYLQSRPPLNAASWQFQQGCHQQQGQSLPSFPIFLRPQPKASSQPCQSVVSPPGQGNHPHMVYMSSAEHHRLQFGPVNTPSKQSQLAQQNLHFEQPARQMQQNFLQDSLGSSFQQTIPRQSTGSPSEVDWPPTPEPQNTDCLDVSETDISMSSVESSDLLSSIRDCGQIDINSVNSPQSPWSGSNTSSIVSASPRPDMTGPWSPPDSTLGSPGEPLSPETSTFIKSPGAMTSGMVTVSSINFPSPHSPPKRQRTDSTRSTDSQEASERIHTIKKYLKGSPNASPIHMPYSGYPISQQYQPEHQSFSPSLTPSHYFQTPSQTQVYTPQPPPYVYSRPETPPEGELEAFRKYLAEWSVEDLVALDEDRDTVLHLAIVQLKVALSSAIIERIYYGKRTECLNIRNKLLQTPLYLSVISNIPALTEILINYGADLTLGNMEGDTPLHAAAIHGNNSAVEAICNGLFTRGYTEENACRLFNTNNYDGKTPLMLAVENHGKSDPQGLIVDSRETVKLLLTSHYASALWQDTKSGKTALHYAIELRKYDLMCILLDNSEDPMRLVNSQMYNGNTALHLIVGRELPEKDILVFVNLLMNHGANVGIQNAEKEKPSELAHRKHLELRQRLHGQGKIKK